MKFKRTPIATAVALLLIGNEFSAYAAEQADQAQADQVETVVVTGIRSSIESSIATKRNSDSIVEAITAEDIGKLPDVSIAESLARLPGIAAQRVDGRAQSLSIRGMAPRFGVTLLNGREMVSTGDDRSFEYDQFPSELVNSATVYKTPDAALGTQGLSGTVNLQTVHPLDYTERKVNLNARMEKNSFGDIIPGSDSKGGRLSGSYIDQFADHTVGVAVGVAHLDSPNQKKYFNPWDFGQGANISVGSAGSQYTFNGLETGVSSTKSTRDGLLAVVEYKPNDTFRSQVDLFSSKFKQGMNGRELVVYWADWANGTAPGFTPNAAGTTGGVATNTTPLITQRKDDRDDRVNAIGWNNELKIDKWTATGDLSYSRATRHEFIGEVYATSTNPVDATVHFPSDFSGFGSLSSSYDFSNPANFALSTAWWGGGGAVSVVDVKDKMNSLRLSAKRDLDWGAVSAFDGGIVYSDRSKDMNKVSTNYNLANGTACNVGSCAPIPGGILQSPVSLGFVGVPSMLSFDVLGALNSGAYVASPSDPKDVSWNWGVNEKITTAFAKLGLNYDAKIPVHGNVGVQVVNAKQHATGVYNDQGNPPTVTPVDGGKNYTDVLPSLNLIGDITTNTFLRFGAAKVIARPNMEDLRAGVTGTVSPTGSNTPGSPGTWSGSSGNPDLEPWRANALDLSLEKYFSKGTYVAVAGFNKQITTGIYTKDFVYDFSNFRNTTGLTPTSSFGTLTKPTNTNGGKIHGWELSGAVEGSYLNQYLKGFGVLGSYSKTQSSLPGTDAFGAPMNTSLEGLSGDVWGLTGYYENNGFQTRIAQRYRSEFNAMRHNAFKLVMDSIRPEKITDFQIGYVMQSGTYKGTGILFQVNNVFNTPYVVTQTVDGITALKEYHQYGRQFLLGVNYKL